MWKICNVYHITCMGQKQKLKISILMLATLITVHVSYFFQITHYKNISCIKINIYRESILNEF